MAGYPRYFYPRPPRGGRPEFPVRNANREIISIHALREEGDRAGLPESAGRKDFYPRPPRGGRRQAVLRRMRPPDISIHALREEGNRALTGTSAVVSKFLSTPSARRATWVVSAARPKLANFYPRPPRGGRLGSGAMRGGIRLYFYPRPPRGGRRKRWLSVQQRKRFLSTPSARRATNI